MGRKKQYCKSCDWTLDDSRKSFHKDNETDVKRTKDYCENHNYKMTREEWDNLPQV